MDYLKKFYLKNEITQVNGFKINYDLPKSYKFHKKGNKFFNIFREQNHRSFMLRSQILTPIYTVY